MKGFKDKSGKFRPTGNKRSKIEIGDNPENDPVHNKFIDTKMGDGLRGRILALKKDKKEAIILSKNTSLGDGVKWGELYLVKEDDPEEYPKTVKKVSEIPRDEDWEIRVKQSLGENVSDDLVTGIIRAESGEMDNEELREFVLKHQDTLMQLQGSWQRTVQSVLEQEEVDVVSTPRQGDPDHAKAKYGELTRKQKTLVKKYVQKHPDVVRFEDFEWDNFEEIENANPSEFIHSAVEQYVEELYEEGHKD